MSLQHPSKKWGYHPAIYSLLDESARRSSQVIAPLVVKLVNPESVVDFGCGTGGWLETFRSLGVADILGVDFHDLPQEHMRIPKTNYRTADLTQPIDLRRQFDLVLSLEVAEHLPPKAEDTYLNNLTRAGRVVMFSAAIPGQLGFGHVNERWQSYWASKFEARGFLSFECIRPRVWSDPSVDVWYSQNTLLYVSKAAISSFIDRLDSGNATSPQILDVVHPSLYAEKSAWLPGVVGRWFQTVLMRFPQFWALLSRRRRDKARNRTAVNRSRT